MCNTNDIAHVNTTHDKQNLGRAGSDDIGWSVGCRGICDSPRKLEGEGEDAEENQE